MKVPLYILGFLSRYGPQHGYRLKQALENVSDFASIKLPTIYYHLEKMEKKGFISASREKEGRRPEKWVYTITAEGRDALRELLDKALASTYRGEFLVDSVFYFNELVGPEETLETLRRQVQRLQKSVSEIETHREEVLQQQPERRQVFTKAIFRHHEYHHQAELKWVQDTVDELDEYIRNTQQKTEE